MANPTPSASMSDHIVFFIHGMGQQYEEFGNLKIHVATLQKNTEELLAAHYPDTPARVKFIPIEWHSVVHKLVDDKIDLATLGTVPKVRLVTNHWVMDCLYYFTKPHGQRIIDTICEQCNEAYEKHVKEFPDFEGNNGQVHMMGCSLGGIAAFDILAQQWNKDDGRPPWESVEEQAYVVKKPDIHVPKLDFKVQSLWTCGSPVAATLVLRGLDFLHYRPPLRTKVFNVFHPFDPLGYRIEPMVNKSYVDVQPVRIDKLQRRRILPMPLPKIPNLGIKSSIAGAAPLIMRARRTFLRYMMTSEGTLIMDKNITERTVVDNGQSVMEEDELQVQSADELPYDNRKSADQERDDSGVATADDAEFRPYDSAPEAEAMPVRPYMSRRISSRHTKIVRRRSHSVRDGEERIWLGADDTIGPRFLYESEERTTQTTTTDVVRPIWTRKWFQFDKRGRSDTTSTDSTLVHGQPDGSDDDKSLAGSSTEKASSKAASIIGMAGTVATAALSAVGLSHHNTDDTNSNSDEQQQQREKDSSSSTSPASTIVLPGKGTYRPVRAVSTDFICVPAEYSSIVPNLEAIATAKSPVFDGTSNTSYFYDTRALSESRTTKAKDDDLSSESSYSTAIGLEVFSSPASLDRASLVMTIPEDDLLDLDGQSQSDDLQKQIERNDSNYNADDSGSDDDNETKIEQDTTSNQSDEESQSKTGDKLIDGIDGQHYPRIDYVLNETVIDAYASEWIVAMKSHFKYWANRDLTFHMIKTLLGDA